MKKSTQFVFIAFALIFFGCSSDSDSGGIPQNHLKINGTTVSIYDTDLSISINGGNFTYDPQTGNPTATFSQLNIDDPDQVLTGLFNGGNLTDTVHLRFINHVDNTPGNHTTVSSSAPIGVDDVIAEFHGDDRPAVYADPNQDIYIKITDDKIIIKFSNVTYGADTLSGNLMFNY